MNQSIKTLKICRVIPFTDSTISVVESWLPLTHFGTMWIKFFPITQRVFFYELAETTHTFFDSVLIPKLKHTLSLALTHFLHVAGNIVWPVDALKPFFLYTPNDSVMFIIAESNLDFKHFSHNKMSEVVDLHPLIPELPVSDSKSSIISFKITLFPNQGFCLGISMHHAMFDGKSVALFMKVWAHICKHNQKQYTPLPPELAPVFDRTLVDDPHGLDVLNLNNWWICPNPNPKSLKLPHVTRNMKNVVRAVFELSHEDINKLRKHLVSQLNEEDLKNIHLSTFVVSYAYIITSLVKAKKLEIKGKVGVMFAVDCRSRLNPKLPDNYFGSFVKGSFSIIDTKTILENNGISAIAIELIKMIKEMDERVKSPNIEQEHDEIMKFKNSVKIVDMMIGVAGSPRFEIYGTDFGWGKPKATQVVSIDKSTTISMAESRDGNGGIEIGLVLKKHDMEMFSSLFVNGLKDM